MRKLFCIAKRNRPLMFGAAFIACGAAHPSARAVQAAELSELVPVQGGDYLQLRDELLAQHPQPWNVDIEVRQSWERGLLAYILNQRLTRPQDFTRWDAQQPRLRASTDWYDLAGKLEPTLKDAQIGFLVEKMLKAPTELERNCAWETLNGRLHSTVDASGSQLWRSIWESATDERLRFVALPAMCADPDQSSQALIVAFLRIDDDRLAGYSARGQCLLGMYHRNTEQTADAIFDSWDTLNENNRWTSDAIGVLAVNASTRARRAVYQFILDPKNREWDQKDAIAKCSIRPLPEDAAVIRDFLGRLRPGPTKTDVVQGLGRWPIEIVGPVLRDLLRDSNEDSVIAAAGFALAQCHESAKDIGSRDAVEDIALLESIAQGDKISKTTRIHFGMHVERIKGNNPKLPDRLPED